MFLCLKARLPFPCNFLVKIRQVAYFLTRFFQRALFIRVLKPITLFKEDKRSLIYTGSRCFRFGNVSHKMLSLIQRLNKKIRSLVNGKLEPLS